MADESTRLTRRELFGAAIGAALSAAVWTQIAAQGETTEELVLVTGRIQTMDERTTIAGTVSIRNGRFSTVDGAAPTPRPGTRLIDLKGRTAVPGIIDNHNHIVLMGNRPGYHTPLENAYSIREVQEIVAARAKGIPSAPGSRRLEDSTAIICFGLTRLHVCPRLRSLMRLRRTILCTSRRDSPVLRRRTVWVRNSSKAKRHPFPLPLMG